VKNNEKKIAMLIFIIIVTEIVGMFSGLLAGDIRQIYDGLNKIGSVAKFENQTRPL
jgi:hypothetical protein